MRFMNIAAVIVVLAVAAATPALAAKGGNGNGNPNPGENGNGGGNATPNGSCTVSGNVVTGTGLPTDQVVNFMVTDNGGNWGWVLGYTPDGTWAVTVPAQNGATTYEFASRTFGPDGSKYSVFASCS